MRKFLVLLFFAIFSTVYGQDWAQISDFPGASRDDGTGFTIGDSAYFGTGITPWFSPLRNFYGLDLKTDEWFSVASLPNGKERQYASSFAKSNHGYVFGGYNGSDFLNDLWRYEPNTNTWSELTGLPGAGRSGAACFVIEDTAYIIGGKTTSDIAINEVWAYTMSTDTWVQKSSLPNGNRWRASADAVNGSGFLVFGRDENDIFHNDLLLYMPVTDSWTQVSNFPVTGRSHATMIAFDDELLISCGFDSLGNFHNDLWSYRPSIDSWNTFPGVPGEGRRGGIAIKTNQNFIYYTTGLTGQGSRLKETWKYHQSLSYEYLNYLESPKTIIKITDILGREVPETSNELRLYFYSDGSTEKIIRME